MGYGIIVVATLVGAYYNTMIGWAFYFLVASFEPKVPWGLCNQTWNTPDCVTADSRINATDGELASSATEYFEYVANRSCGVSLLQPMCCIHFILYVVLIMLFSYALNKKNPTYFMSLVAYK